ncbi:Imm59 family immunity protein [Listeria fleischmannii]|uniref:Imm59 family immunity protein n=1 Tax=Listeria fleischmannii TaxID=1069827 RepID=UPI000254F560|nr:Imm59 family immunity protein [Listeria fleischmannii]EIA18850.1 hypothetical protein KKC_15629 [Listeria fleischmannii subsp. coloradonensis]STY36146.1 Uncharacterised protein [Listeria fleischmannii subsp. coloradonensis]
MIEEIMEYKKIIEDAVELLGYTSLRYSLFEEANMYKEEYQIRIEYIDEHFEVYATGERASVSGKSEYIEFAHAYKEFMYKLQLIVLRNRRRVRDGEPPEYSCPLWNK